MKSKFDKVYITFKCHLKIAINKGGGGIDFNYNWYSFFNVICFFDWNLVGWLFDSLYLIYVITKNVCGNSDSINANYMDQPLYLNKNNFGIIRILINYEVKKWLGTYAYIFSSCYGGLSYCCKKYTWISDVNVFYKLDKKQNKWWKI